jgi:flavodoxin
MKTLIIYGSLYGNTEQIAKAIGGAIAGEVKVVKVGENKSVNHTLAEQCNALLNRHLQSTELGSPTVRSREVYMGVILR